MSWVESGGGVTTGSDPSFGDITADSVILDVANADAKIVRNTTAQLEARDSSNQPTSMNRGFSREKNTSGTSIITVDTANAATLGHRYASTASLFWNSTASGDGTADVGLARNAAGVLEVTDGSTGEGTIVAANGSASAPTYAFVNDPDCGMYRFSTNWIGWAVNGSLAMDLNTSDFTLNDKSLILNDGAVATRIDGGGVTLTDGSATDILVVTLATGAMTGFTIHVGVFGTDATDFQAVQDVVTVQAVNKAGTITVTPETVHAGTPVATSGTLTRAYSVADNGDGTFDVRLNANSSLTTPTVTCKVVVVQTGSSAQVVQ